MCTLQCRWNVCGIKLQCGCDMDSTTEANWPCMYGIYRGWAKLSRQADKYRLLIIIISNSYHSSYVESCVHWVARFSSIADSFSLEQSFYMLHHRSLLPHLKFWPTAQHHIHFFHLLTVHYHMVVIMYNRKNRQITITLSISPSTSHNNY